MSERSARRTLLRLTALATAALLAFGGTAGALAQDDPTSTTPTPTETVTPPSPSADPEPAPPTSTEPSTTPPPSSTDPAPPADPSTPVTPVAPPAATVEPVKPAEQKTEQEQQKVAPDLQLSVKFDRPEYALGEPVGITVTARNAGDATANQVRFASETYQMYLTSGVDDLVSRPNLAPGETKTIKLGGTAQWAVQKVALTLRAYVEGSTDKTPNDNMSRDETTILTTAGTVTGVLFEDLNGNGSPDSGEGLDNQSFRLTGGPAYPHWINTYNGGQFEVHDVPAGTYQVRYVSTYRPGGSLTVKPGQFVVVKSGETTRVSLQTAPVLSRSLHVTGHSFDKTRYAKGDPIAVSVTLSNSGTAPITGLVAVCDPENDPATLDGTADGWGALRPDRGGVTIGAGETKTFTVTDTVPDVAYPTGRVYFACAFSVDGRNGSTGPGAADPGLTASADVAGTLGKVSGHLLHDGSPVDPGVKVVAFNPGNNRVVGEATTYDSIGSWRIDNLVPGKVALKVVGPWKLADGSPQRIVDVVAEQNVSVDLDVVPGPEVKDPTVFAPDLKVSVTFDKETYDISDPVRMTIKVENVGTGAAPGRGDVRSTYHPQQPYFDYYELRKLLDAPVDLWPGESRQITVTGSAPDGGNDPERLRKLSYVVEVSTPGTDPDPGNNKAEARANVTWSTGSAVVTVYGDRNLNKKLDAGEELANRPVRVGGGKPHVNKYANTDVSGRVLFTDLPAGRYGASDEYDRESGWIPDGSNTDVEQTAVVNPGDEGTALVRLIRPLSDELKASVKFDKPAYEPGAAVGISVSITNNSAKTLQVKADCGGGFGAHLGNDTAGWRELHRDGPGVQVASGSTVDFGVTIPLPAESPDYGYVTIGCSFGPEPNLGNPFASAEAKVPGATQTFRGLVVTGDYQAPKPVPNVKLVLLDPDTDKPVVSTTTDANGGWVFPDLAVGVYTPLVVGPWKVVDFGDDGEPFGNVRGRDYPSYVWIQPGPDVADPTTGARPAPGGPNGAAPVKTIKNTDALANTGVSVLGLALFGVLLVLAGAAMRRRPALR